MIINGTLIKEQQEISKDDCHLWSVFIIVIKIISKDYFNKLGFRILYENIPSSIHAPKPTLSPNVKQLESWPFPSERKKGQWRQSVAKGNVPLLLNRYYKKKDALQSKVLLGSAEAVDPFRCLAGFIFLRCHINSFFFPQHLYRWKKEVHGIALRSDYSFTPSD